MADLFLTETESRDLVAEQGQVPLSEVLRIIQEQGAVLAENIHETYRGVFEKTSTLEFGFEDPEHKIHISKGPGHESKKVIVFITPEDTKERGYGLYGYPKVYFFWKKEGDEWKYDGAMLNSDDVGQVRVGGQPLRQDVKNRLWHSRVNMRDVERSLGRYLPKNTPE